MAKITILGAGKIGSAFSIPLIDNGHDVNLVGTHLDDATIEQLNQDRVHPKLGIPLPDKVRPFTYDCLAEAVVESDLLVLAVSSLGIDWVGMMLMMSLDDALSPDVPILFLTKGLEGKNDGNHYVSKNERLRILPETLRDALLPHHADRLQIMAMGGPFVASELAARCHTSVVLAGPNQAQLDTVAELLPARYYHVRTSTDLIGVEVCASLKNLYALAVGLVEGLNEVDQHSSATHRANHNAAAAIFAQGSWETSYLVEHMGGEQQTILGIAGAGDFYAACQDEGNLRMGRLLGSGMLYTDAKQQHMPHETIEGAELALAIGRTIEYLCREGDLDPQRLPLLRMMTNIVCNDGVVDIPWNAFFAIPNGARK